MPMKIKIENDPSDVLDKITNSLRWSNGQFVEGQFIPNRMDLSSDNRQAWINYLAEQHEKKQPFQDPPAELKITSDEVIATVSKRVVNRIMGK